MSGTRDKPEFPRFREIDGRHPFRKAVPAGFIDYEARTRRGGKVFYFNFDLAKEMGLIPKNTPAVLTPSLSHEILRAFSLQIINEYDILHNLQVPKRSLRKNKYMATRYLQLQHPDKRGLTSGDGRSIWNGYLTDRKAVWDISSSGTGATRLSPATAIHKKFFKTGSRMASYGCGQADLLDGICAALMSEILHFNRINTERTLAVIDFGDGSSINVRAGKNLLRPAHFFCYLKQGDLRALESLMDFYIEREVRNGDFPAIRERKKRYHAMLERITRDFARAAAVFENEYIFCWMDWDGDNILIDGGIIDYGSVRQFGLYHHEYRYDDVDKMSTTIVEQKNRAKYIVQTFAQLFDYLMTGKKKAIGRFRRHRMMNEFTREFEKQRDAAVLYKMGIPEDLAGKMYEKRKRLVREFRNVFAYFEKVKSRRGHYEVADGVTRDAIFCLRDLMRELPKFFLKGAFPLNPRMFLDILKSSYASQRDLRLTEAYKRHSQRFQALYAALVRECAKTAKMQRKPLLKAIAARSEIINRYDRVTGDSILQVAQYMIRMRRKVQLQGRCKIMREFIRDQILRPESLQSSEGRNKLNNKNMTRIFQTMREVVKDCREGI